MYQNERNSSRELRSAGRDPSQSPRAWMSMRREFEQSLKNMPAAEQMRGGRRNFKNLTLQVPETQQVGRVQMNVGKMELQVMHDDRSHPENMIRRIATSPEFNMPAQTRSSPRFKGSKRLRSQKALEEEVPSPNGASEAQEVKVVSLSLVSPNAIVVEGEPITELKFQIDRSGSSAQTHSESSSDAGSPLKKPRGSKPRPRMPSLLGRHVEIVRGDLTGSFGIVHAGANGYYQIEVVSQQKRGKGRNSGKVKTVLKRRRDVRVVDPDAVAMVKVSPTTKNIQVSITPRGQVAAQRLLEVLSESRSRANSAESPAAEDGKRPRQYVQCMTPRFWSSPRANNCASPNLVNAAQDLLKFK